MKSLIPNLINQLNFHNICDEIQQTSKSNITCILYYQKIKIKLVYVQSSQIAYLSQKYSNQNKHGSY